MNAKTLETIKPEIQKVLRQIIEGFNPRKVILFGSHAYGEPGPDSDVDLLVVMETKERAIRKAGEISGAIEHPFPIDILVRTPEKIRERIEMGDGFVREIMTKGVVLYEAPDSLNSSIEYKQMLLWHLDLLGFKELILNKYRQEPLKIFDLLIRFKSIIKLINHKIPPAKTCYIRGVSDTIIVAIPASRDKQEFEQQLSLSFGNIAEAQIQLADEENILIRGSITFGDLYIEEPIISPSKEFIIDYVFGPALIRAIELEKCAEFPRIIIDPKIMKDVQGKDREYLIEDSEGLFYIDYLSFACNNFLRDNTKFMDKHREIILNLLNNEEFSESTLRKGLWLKRYHNNTIRDNQQCLDDLGIKADDVIIR